VLIQGAVKMIVFDEKHPLSKGAMREITNTIFKKLRINKEIGLRARDTGS
jgi:hypothetical protein